MGVLKSLKILMILVAKDIGCGWIAVNAEKVGKKQMKGMLSSRVSTPAPLIHNLVRKVKMIQLQLT